MISLPMPGQEKIVSVTTAKASVEPNSSPNTVTSGIAISRSTWRRRIVHSRLAGRARELHGVGQHHLARAGAREADHHGELEQREVERRQQQVAQAVRA